MNWLREMELLASTNDMGRDYEHAEELIKRLDDAAQEAGVDEQLIAKVNELGKKLLDQGAADSKTIREQMNAVNEK